MLNSHPILTTKPSRLLIAQGYVYDNFAESDHSRTILDQAHSECIVNHVPANSFFSQLPLRAVRLWSRTPVRDSYSILDQQRFIPTEGSPDLADLMSNGIRLTLAYRSDNWNFPFLMIVNGNREERAIAYSASVLIGHVRRLWSLDPFAQAYFR